MQPTAGDPPRPRPPTRTRPRMGRGVRRGVRRGAVWIGSGSLFGVPGFRFQVSSCGVPSFSVLGGRFGNLGQRDFLDGRRVLLEGQSCLLLGATPLRGGRRVLFDGPRHLLLPQRG